MNRKELLREYKETKQPMGLFQVKNLNNGKVLIGSSPNLPAILNRMRSQLEMNGHPNRQLQQDWNSLGVGAFSFEILDELKYPDTEGYDPTKDLKELLALWMEKLQPFGKRGYHSERA